MSGFSRCCLAVALVFPLTASSVGAQSSHASHEESMVPLYGNLGPHSRAITTSSDTAQAYFNQGMQFMYAFGTGSATESFRAAQHYDPNCAMCFFGEAWSLSPYLNGGMSADGERRAYTAINEAKRLNRNATDIERALIDAMAIRYDEEPSADRRRLLDSLYSEAMAGVVRQFPDDLDVATLWGESLMLLRPRRGSVDLHDPLVRKITGILEGVLERDIRHPGACHLYIHLVEASQDPGKAENCADYLGDAIPGASHIRHMPSHIYMNIGRYSDAVRANQHAWHTDQQAEYGGPPGIYPSHNLHMLLFAATLDGQSAVAIQAAKDLAVVSPASAFYYPVALAIFGRWNEVLALQANYENVFQEAMFRFARGLANLRTDDVGAARTDLWLVESIIESLPDSLRFRFHPQNVLLQIPAGILRGEILAAEGKYDEAIEVLEAAVTVEDNLVYDEPEPWHLPARHVLGAIMMDDERFVDAVQVYRDALEDNPNTGWALFGLEKALRATGDTEEADAVAAEFKRHWARSDIWLRSSRY